MNIEIRQATFQDLDELNQLIPKSALALQSAYYSRSVINTALELVCGIQELILKTTFVVAEFENNIIGCGGWSVKPIQKSQSAELRSFFIDPCFARKGIASKLLYYCENSCQNSGIKTLVLTSTLAGEAFYAKNGFSVVDNIIETLSSGEYFPLIRMQKNI